MCFSDSYFRSLRSAMDGRNMRRAPALSGSLKGFVADDVAVYQSHIGAPASAMLFDILIASGVERLLMLGMAGSISRDCHIGDIVVPTWGIREEGTSYHYLRPDVLVKASPDMLTRIRRRFAPLEPIEGGVWTTDAPYRETPGKIRRYSGMGALAVDMECTALMSVARRRRRSFGSVLVITDEVRPSGWNPAFRGKKVGRSRRAVCEAAAGCLG